MVSENMQNDLTSRATSEPESKNLKSNSVKSDYSNTFHINYQTVFDALHNGAPSQVLNYLVEKIDSTYSIEDWSIERGEVQVVPVWKENLEISICLLEELGLNPNFVRKAASDSLELSASFAKDAGYNNISTQLLNLELKLKSEKSKSDFFETLINVQGGFSRLVASTGRAYNICPFTGVLLISQHSIPVALDTLKQVCIFYRFKSIETFYIIVSSFSGGKEFLYIPGRKVLLRLHEPYFAWGEANEMISVFDKISLKYASQIAVYLENNTSRSILVGTMDNLGHSIWNDLSGFDAYQREGFLSEVKIGLSYRHRQIDAFCVLKTRHTFNEELFVETSDSLLLTSLERNLLLFRPSSYSVSQELAHLVIKHASCSVSSEQLKLVQEAQKSNHIIWINFRAHNKTWINFMDVVPRLISRLIESFGSVAVFADGMPDCIEQGDELARLLPEGATIYRGFGLPLNDSIYWCSVIDSYIATIGSGLTLVTWIAAKPGIAHSETSHLNQMGFWSDVRPDSPAPLVPQINEIEDLGSGMYCNYKIEEHTMLNLLDKLVESINQKVS